MPKRGLGIDVYSAACERILFHPRWMAPMWCDEGSQAHHLGACAVRGINSTRKRELRDKLLKRAKWRCEYCGCAVDRVTMTVDHWVPQALGGTNKPDNLRSTCGPCNAEKGNMTPWEWITREAKVAA